MLIDIRPCVIATVLLWAVPHPARAYRTLADLPELDTQGELVRWRAPIPLELSDLTDGPRDARETADAVMQSLRTWNSTECVSPLISFEGTVESSAALGDGFSTVQWVTEGWLDIAPSDSLAWTDTSYEVLDGRWSLIEADVYLNGDTIDWSASAPGREEPLDLQAVVTHELGHALGLAHPCEPDGAEGAPECNEADFPLTAMHPTYDPGQVELFEDDIAGLCELYPPGTELCDDCDDVEDPTPTTEPGCTVIGPRANARDLQRSLPWVAIGLLVGALYARLSARGRHARRARTLKPRTL